MFNKQKLNVLWTLEPLLTLIICKRDEAFELSDLLLAGSTMEGYSLRGFLLD